VTSVVITRRRHPLEGRSLRVLGRMRRHGRLELLLVLPDGSKSLLPAAWTDLDGAAADPGIDGQPGAATLGSLTDLLQAAAVIAALSVRTGTKQAARQSPCKEDHRAAYPAQSATRPDPGATPDAARPAPAAAGHRHDRAAGPPHRQGSRAGGQAGRR
jgi:hypothetical protein